MQRNIRFLIAYDGTDFHGWQTQPEMRTVQEVIEQASRRVTRQQVGLNAAGRTDAGVHAAGQQANFETACEIPLPNLRKAIGSRLPKDVSLLHVSEVPLGFRCSQDAVSKLYRYRIYNATHRPVQEHIQRYTYHFWNNLDLDRMRDAAARLVGTHDFAGLASKGSERETTVRTILRADVSRRFEEVHVDVEGTGFLYNQVRNIVGTLLEIGRGHWGPERIDEILAARDRALAGPTAPARGLCLQWVKYDLTRPPGWKGFDGQGSPAEADTAETP